MADEKAGSVIEVFDADGKPVGQIPLPPGFEDLSEDQQGQIVDGLVKSQADARGELEDPGAVAAFAEGGVQGASLAFEDEAEGGLRALDLMLKGDARPFGEIFDEQVQIPRKRIRAAEQNQPAAFIAGNIGGAIATTPLLPGGGAIRGISAAEKAVSGAKQGAAIGGAFGVGSGEGVQDRIEKGVVGAGGGAVGGAVLGPLARGDAPSAGKQVVQAADRIGVPVSRGVASDDLGTQALTQGARAIPLIGGKIDEAVDASVRKLGKAVDDASGRLAGVRGTQEEVGAAARKSLEKASDALESRADGAFKKLRNAIDPGQAVQAPQKALDEINAIVESRVAAGDTGIPLEGLNKAVELLTRPEGATFNGLQRARTELAKAIKFDVRQGGGFLQGDLKRAFGAITDAMEDAVRATAKGSPDDAVKQLEVANKQFASVLGETQEIAKFLARGSDERLVEKIISFGSNKGDGKRLDALVRSLGPDERGQIGGFVLERLGKNQAGEFSPAFFVKNYNNMSDRAKGLMFGPAGTGTRQSVDDIMTVANRFKQVDRFRNFSNTGRAAATVLGIGSAGGFVDPVEALDAALKIAAVGVPLVAVLSGKASAASMGRWSRAYQSVLSNPTGKTAATFRIATRNLASTIGERTGFQSKVGELAEAIQGSIKATAEGDQGEAPGIGNDQQQGGQQ